MKRWLLITRNTRSQLFQAFIYGIPIVGGMSFLSWLGAPWSQYAGWHLLAIWALMRTMTPAPPG